MAQPSNTRKYIDNVLYGDTVPGKSDLAHLSNLNTDDLETFKQEWVKVESSRRQNIVLQLVHLGKTNFRYNFSRIFRFLLDDPDPDTRSVAITGLAEEEDELFISRLIRLVKEDSAEQVREAAVTALGKFAILAELKKLSDYDSKAIYDVLWSVLKSEKETPEIKSKALVSIAAFHVPPVKALIEEAYHDTNVQCRSNALRAMGRNCDPLWLETLFEELDNDDIEIQYEAIIACGELSDDKAVPVLISLTGDKNVRIREAAIKALGEIGGQKARDTLNNLAKNSRGRTRQAALSAIKELEICEDFSSMNY
jgi:HEAT repeat protein